MTSVTFIIPTIGRNTLQRSIDCLLEQTIQTWKAIVIFDEIEPTIESSDERIKIMTCEKKGVGKNGAGNVRNYAIQYVDTEWIAFLDDDDTLNPGIETILNEMVTIRDSRPYYFDFTVINEIREDNQIVEISRTDVSLDNKNIEDIYVKNIIPIHCIIYPKHIISDIYFDEKMRAYEDWEFLLHVIKSVDLDYRKIVGVNLHNLTAMQNDRRGSSEEAKNFYAVLDYLYTYHRHPAPTPTTKESRSKMLEPFGLSIHPSFL